MERDLPGAVARVQAEVQVEEVEVEVPAGWVEIAQELAPAASVSARVVGLSCHIRQASHATI
jgi:hypothetical protein